MRRGLVIVFALLLTSCYARGTKVDQAQLALLMPGTTTYFDVVAKYGPPSVDTRRSDGSREIIYSHLQMQQNWQNFVPILGAFEGGQTAQATTVTFEFDAQDRLLSYASTYEQSKQGTGIFSGGRP